MKISISAFVNSSLDTVWACWNNPADINQWCAASDAWHTTDSTVDLRVGGKFSIRMEAKDGNMGFDFAGTYTKIVEKSLSNTSWRMAARFLLNLRKKMMALKSPKLSMLKVRMNLSSNAKAGKVSSITLPNMLSLKFNLKENQNEQLY
jgi:uncharacterized protein YndB with AHSA1/START domain